MTDVFRFYKPTSKKWLMFLEAQKPQINYDRG